MRVDLYNANLETQTIFNGRCLRCFCRHILKQKHSYILTFVRQYCIILNKKLSDCFAKLVIIVGRHTIPMHNCFLILHVVLFLLVTVIYCDALYTVVFRECTAPCCSEKSTTRLSPELNYPSVLKIKTTHIQMARSRNESTRQWCQVG